MEKCPPAEACRDAFERMSKATVQMCMSTTGFGFDVPSGREGTTLDTPSRPSFTRMTSGSTYPDLSARQYQRPKQEIPVETRRPPPKFDMNLRDLFPHDINQDDLASQSVARQRQPQYMREPNQPIPMQPLRPSRQYSVPPQQGSLNSQINADFGITANQSPPGIMSQYPPQLQQQQQQQDTMQQTQGPTPSPFYNPLSYGENSTNIPELEFLQSNEYNPNFDTAGIDLGFGPGMDFQHDWSDGTGVDMFDGFFFGNSAG